MYRVDFRRYFLLVILMGVLSTGLLSQGSWEIMEVPTTNNLNSISFVDSLTGWVVGDSGTIMHTDDGGRNWVVQQSNTNNEIIDVFFLNSEYGWAASHGYSSLPYGTLLLSTKDGGNNWDTVSYHEDNIFITSIFYHDTLTGWMGGTPHALVSTNDGGLNWGQAVIDTSTLAFFPVLNIEFYDEKYGYASGGIFDIAGVIWRTSNGGQNWYAIDPDDAPADEVHGLYPFDSVNVIGSGGDPDFGFGVGFTKTNNGGISWEYDEVGIQGIAFDVDFVNHKEGWAPLGFENKFIYSLDTGNTWAEVSTPELTSIFDIVFTDSLHGYAVGRNGAFLKFIPQDYVGIEETGVGSSIKIYQNYPNPFQHSTTIEFEYHQVVSSNIIFLVIYDIMGDEVMNIIPEKKGRGHYKAVISNHELSQGIFFYRVICDETVSNMKTMILVD